MKTDPRVPTWKKVLFVSIPLLLVLIAVESGLRLYISDESLDHPVALIHAFHLIVKSLFGQHAETTVYTLELEELVKVQDELVDSLYEEENLRLLIRFQEEYERHFARIVKEAHEIGSRLVVLYLPSLWERPGRIERIIRPCKAFFRDLAHRYHVDFLCIDDELMTASWEEVTLYPRDSHLSRAGNALIAGRLATYLHRFHDYRSAFHFTRHPDLMGDLAPDFHGTVRWRPELPFEMNTNSQGLRMDHDLVFPKTRQRILILGDSFTFGPYIPNEDTYPDLTNRIDPDLEVINAGYPAYTVVDEADLFHDRAKYTEPDITVLQVLDNDIYGFYSVMLNLFSRAKRLENREVRPTSLEMQVLDHVLGSHVLPPKPRGL